MPLEAGLQTSIPAVDHKAASHLSSVPLSHGPGQSCMRRDLTSDPAGSLPGTWWETHLSVYVTTGQLSADPVADPEVDSCPSTSPTDQGPGAIQPETKQDPCPPEPLVIGPPTS